MLGHARALFFVDHDHLSPSNDTIPLNVLYFLTGFGHQAVMVFFVLSGFLIASSVLRNLERSTWSWRDYAIDRAVRLYLVLVPGLLIGGVLDIVGLHYFNQQGIYSTPLLPFGGTAFAQRLTISSFFGSLLFLQTRFTTVFGSNDPLWSLFNEFWYYVLFPALIWLMLCINRRSKKAMIYLCVAIFAAWILGTALAGFVVWLSGAIVALTARNLPFPKSHGWVIGLYLISTAMIATVCLSASRIDRAGGSVQIWLLVWQ